LTVSPPTATRGVRRLEALSRQRLLNEPYPVRRCAGRRLTDNADQSPRRNLLPVLSPALRRTHGVMLRSPILDRLRLEFSGPHDDGAGFAIAILDGDRDVASDRAVGCVLLGAVRHLLSRESVVARQITRSVNIGQR
jgi:hypothetical protein